MTTHPHPPPSPAVSARSSRPLVLIADPSPGIWTAVQTALTAGGIASRLAATSAEALRLARRHHPAVCMVAVMLTVDGRPASGAKLAGALRQLDPSPTVALTRPGLCPAGKAQVGGELLPMLDPTRHPAVVALILVYVGWRPGS